MSSRHIHLSPVGLEHVLREELGPRLIEERGRLFLTEQPTAHFAQDSWADVQSFAFESISQAAKHLRAIQRNWWLHSINVHRRAALIQAALPPIKPKPFAFGSPAPTAPLGAWTLWDDRTLMYAAQTSSPFVDGEVLFQEDKVGPPSRAYLKLWEWFTLNGVKPAAGETCLDLGSSPGGWTWVLDQLGARVISVDKAPLSPDVKWSKRVDYRGESAFGLTPFKVDWLFSDVICYPERLFELVKRWDGFARNMVCTIKFQGETDFATLEKFMAIPGSGCRHLFVNKHELTWWRLG